MNRIDKAIQEAHEAVTYVTQEALRAPEMREALEAALYGMDELIRSYTITHVVRGQCKGQPRITPDEMSAASEAEDQYLQARHKVEAALRNVKPEVAK